MASTTRFERNTGGLTRLTIDPRKEAIAERNYEQSKFLRLPGEIRNRIYTFALGYERMGIITYASSWRPQCKPREHLLALLRVCRQVYLETATLPYALYIFHFADYNCLVSWLNKRPPTQRNEITTMSYTMEIVDSFALSKDDEVPKLLTEKLPRLRRVDASIAYEFDKRAWNDWGEQCLEKIRAYSGKPGFEIRVFH